MSLVRPLIVVAALAGAPGAPNAVAQAYPGQQIQTVPRPTPDADALASAMRRLGANPRDLPALIEAGELSLKLGDVNAAASLLKRAENVDPMNGRVKAGMARILVTQERPGEALRYFDQAIGYGLSPATFAGDRGLAYDLIGQQERAQRDYRTALSGNAGDDVRRRYALSLGISGKRKEALAQIDDQVRRNDRSAWRVRAFILAMTGDVPGAEKIARTMMPPGMGTALAPFFSRLAALPPADRAFAVHFGELSPTPQRIADARMIPALPPLAPEANAAVQVAAAPAPPPPTAARATRSDRQRARDEARRKRELARAERRARREGRPARPTEVAVAAPVRPAPDQTAAFQPPRYAGGVAFAPPQPVVQTVPAPAPTPAPPQPAPTPPTRNVEIAAAPPQPGFSAPAPAPLRATPAPTPAIATSGSPTPGPAAPASNRATSSPSLATTASVPPTPAAAAPAPLRATSAPSQVTATSVPLTPAPAIPAPGPGTTQPIAAAAAPEAVSPAPSEDTILARIMAGISIPGAELGIAPVHPPEPAPAPVPETGTSVATPASIAAAETAKRAADAEATKRATDAEATKRAAGAETTKKVPEKQTPKVDPKKAAAERKAAAAKKLADAKKAEEAKKAAEEARIAKANPARIWVQVAGGANKGDLPKAWAAAQDKAAALKGKAAYTTPLRFTNRLVTGPFKTDAEARDFINTLAKQGISAFAFTSDKGQKMERLSTK